MYDWAEVRGRTDAFWDAVRAALPGDLRAPGTLWRPGRASDAWADPDLLLGQTCGLPYVSGRCGGAVAVGRPVYDVEGARDGTYSSALICRVGDAARLADCAGARAAVNEPGSQSGHNALADAVADIHAGPDPFFAETILTGAHRRSAALVADGGADVAAIDAVAWALFAEVEPARHARLAVIGWTRPMPALPFITAARFAERRETLLAALRAGAHGTTHPTLPRAVLSARDADYEPIRAMAARVSGRALGAEMRSS